MVKIQEEAAAPDEAMVKAPAHGENPPDFQVHAAQLPCDIAWSSALKGIAQQCTFQLDMMSTLLVRQCMEIHSSSLKSVTVVLA